MVTVLPGQGWVLERKDSATGTLDVVPLVGWLVADDGQLHPLPIGIGPEWSVRPRLPQDDGFVVATARRRRGVPGLRPWGVIDEE